MSSLKPERTASEWLAALKEPADDAAVDALRRYLRGGLARAFGSRGDVGDADLDDFAQDATMRVLARLDTFRGESRFTTWATAIAIRVAYTAMRRRHWGDRSLEDLGLSIDGDATPSITPVDPAARTDLLDALRDAIVRDLTPRQRAAILGELAGMPPSVLIEQLGTNRNALYKLHHDARLRLRNALETRGFSGAEVRTIIEGTSNE